MIRALTISAATLCALILQVPAASAQDHVCRFHKTAESLPDDGPRELKGIGERFVIQSCSIKKSTPPYEYSIVVFSERRRVCAYTKQVIFRHLLGGGTVEWKPQSPHAPGSYATTQTFLSASPRPCPEADDESYIHVEGVSDSVFLKIHSFVQELLKDRQKLSDTLRNPVPKIPSVDRINVDEILGGYHISFFDRADTFSGKRPGIVIDFDNDDIVVLGYSMSVL